MGKEKGPTDNRLIEAVGEMESGLIDADLGGGVYKKRVATGTKGKSGGFRTLVCYKRGDLAFFSYGFEKKQRDNINPNDLKGLKLLAKTLFGQSPSSINKAVKHGALVELKFRALKAKFAGSKNG